MKHLLSQLIQYMDWMLLKVYFFALGAGLVLMNIEFYLKHHHEYFISEFLLTIGIIFSIIALWGTYFYKKFIQPYDSDFGSDL